VEISKEVAGAETASGKYDAKSEGDKWREEKIK
jgi:hypothetical protein